MSPWNDQDVVTSYSGAADDATKSWYEDKVNIPAIMQLLPKKGARILDFGCGPGNFTARLAEVCTVTGADASPAMVAQARQKYPDIPFFVWDSLGPLPHPHQLFDAIATKLTLEFIEDLPGVAKNLYHTVVSGGLLVVSVQHPLLAISMHPEEEIPYWGTPRFDVQIGTTGTTVTKIHRNLGEYIDPFIQAGFRLLKIDEPRIPQDIATAHAARPIDLKFPKRLNLQFRT
jgi:SAM-dependent methyltransferase